MHLLITAGPTREYLDSVRFISNGSSGATGFAVAQAAAERGHRVTLISGASNAPKRRGVKLIEVVSADDLYHACLKVFPTVDAVVASAAVCDYKAARRCTHKIKKTDDDLSLELVRTQDTLAELGRIKSDGQILIGFALEDRRGKSAAREKFIRKNLDAVILNAPSAIGGRRNKVSVYYRKRWDDWPDMTKRALGRRIVRLAEQLLKDV